MIVTQANEKMKSVKNYSDFQNAFFSEDFTNGIDSEPEMTPDFKILKKEGVTYLEFEDGIIEHPFI